MIATIFFWGIIKQPKELIGHPSVGEEKERKAGVVKRLFYQALPNYGSHAA